MKLYTLFNTHLKAAFQYKTQGFIWTWADLLPVVIQLYFWTKAFTSQSIIGGKSLDMLIGYYFISGLLYPLLVTHPEYVTANDINKGDLSNWLLRPTIYFNNIFMGEFAFKFNRLAFILPGIGLLAIAVHRILHHSVSIYFSWHIISILALGYMITFFIRMMIGLGAFWFSEIDFIIGLQEVLSFFLAGVVMPLTFFPQWFQTLSSFLPFQYSIFIPTQALMGQYTSPELLHFIWVELIWLGILVGLFKVMWRNGVKGYSGYGN